jgi:hypothetical protein
MELSHWAVVLAYKWQVAMLIFSIGITVSHTLEEVLGEGGPFWTYYNPKIPYWLGAFSVAGVLPVILIYLAYLGYMEKSVFALSLLAGLRLGDSIFSHWLPALFGRRPNPGFTSSFNSAMDAGLLIFIFKLQPWPVMLGIMIFMIVYFGGKRGS